MCVFPLCDSGCRWRVLLQPEPSACESPNHRWHHLQDHIHCGAKANGTHTHHEGIPSVHTSHHYSPLGESSPLCFWPLQSSSLTRPIIPTEFGAKIPTNIRQRYLNTFIDECVKFCPSEDAAFQMVRRAAACKGCRGVAGVFITHVSLCQALDEEKLVCDRSSSKNIYLNVAVNTLKKLRSKSSSCPPPPSSTWAPACSTQASPFFYRHLCIFSSLT